MHTPNKWRQLYLDSSEDGVLPPGAAEAFELASEVKSEDDLEEFALQLDVIEQEVIRGVKGVRSAVQKVMELDYDTFTTFKEQLLNLISEQLGDMEYAPEYD